MDAMADLGLAGIAARGGEGLGRAYPPLAATRAAVAAGRLGSPPALLPSHSFSRSAAQCLIAVLAPPALRFHADASLPPASGLYALPGQLPAGEN